MKARRKIIVPADASKRPDAPPQPLPAPNFPGRIVMHKRLRCPGCGSIRLRTYWTKQLPGCELERYTRCRDCGRQFIAILE